LDLKQIKQPIQADLDAFEKHFKSSMKSNVALLDQITYYIVKRKGKQVRPIFVFLSAQLNGGVTEHTYTGASMIELLHTATLVHDDVVDDSFERRGFFSINALWKNKIAVLVGDYLLSRGLLIAVKNKQFRLLEILSDSVKEMSEGELLQIEKARKLDIREEVYFEIIRQKTATLIAAACAVGAASTGVAEEHIERMRLFGEKIGIAFQIKDDLFDYGDTNVGKPLGIDIKEKKMTLPLIYALNQCSPSEKKDIIRLVKYKNEEKDTVRKVVDFVRQYQGLDYAAQVMEDYKIQAIDIIQDYPPSDAKEALIGLIHFVTNRKK
jgi:octaprenyl-diphosphate synthase